MGLDAWVCCNCIKEGRAPAHPFPELLVFDQTAEPTLCGSSELGLDLWLKHDAWYRESCPHSGRLISKRLGNIALIAHIRAFLETRAATKFRLLRDRVVYDGTHGGDWIGSNDAASLLIEARALRTSTNDPLIVQFADNIIELAEASISTGNPIVF